MNSARRKRLEAAGWRVGTAEEFLGLSREEAAVVQLKLALGASLKRYREQRGLTQIGLAKKIRSSQSRVAKLEAAAPGVSLDLLFRALFATGVTLKALARELARLSRANAA